MSEIQEDDELKRLLRAALPEAPHRTALHVEAIRERAFARPTRLRVSPASVACLLLLVCAAVVVAGLVAQRHFADLAHKAALEVPPE